MVRSESESRAKKASVLRGEDQLHSAWPRLRQATSLTSLKSAVVFEVVALLQGRPWLYERSSGRTE